MLTALIPACSINADRVRATSDAACITITELADTLVRDHALTFRSAHEIAAATARAVIAEGKPLAQGYAAFARAFEQATGQATELSADSFIHTVSPETFVARRDRPGGPAPTALTEALKQYRAKLAGLRLAKGDRNTRHVQGDHALKFAFQELLQG